MDSNVRFYPLGTHLLSDAVPFHLEGRDPERDGILLYKRPGRQEP
jgi:hypothetical protein